MTFALNKFLRLLPAATFAMAAEYLMGLSDSIVCGHIIGEEGLSVINLMQPAMGAVSFLAELVGIGTSVLYSTWMGKFEKRRASEYLTQGLWSALMAGALAAVVFALFRERWAESFGVGGVVLAGLKEYWLWFIPCAVLEPVAFFLSSLCYADGDGRTCSWAYGAQLVCNVVFSVVLTQYFGFKGCAAGTTAGHIIAVAVMLTHFRKQSNSLSFVRHFSFADTVRICRTSMGDASARICQAVLFLFLNMYVVARFGEARLPILAVVVAVLGLSEALDGISKAMQPIAGVYIGEGNDRLTRRIMRYGARTALAEGAAFALLLAAFPQLALSLVGLDDPQLVEGARTAVRIVSMGLIGTAFVMLFNSYWTFISKEMLAFVLTLLAMLAVPAALTGAFGAVLGEKGVWTALALSPYLALVLAAFCIVARWGSRALPLFLDRSHERHLRVWDVVLSQDAICALAEKINKFLVAKQRVGKRKAGLVSLLVEETLMVIMDRNAGKKIRAELSLEFGSDLHLTERDDGEIFDITDADAKISSLRTYLVSNLMIAIPARRNMTTMGFNRNAFCIELAPQPNPA